MQLNREIQISDSSLVQDIQKEFSAWYPFLKIEFLSKDKPVKNSRHAYLAPDLPLKHLVEITACKIDIDKDRTVAELLNDLQHLLPVIVEISRKSGIVWNLISISDGWTLQSQNDAGEFISTEMTKPVEK